MGKRSEKRIFRKKRRVGFTWFASLVVVVLAGLFFLGVDSPERSGATIRVNAVEIPALDGAPRAVADLEAREERAAQRAAKQRAQAKKEQEHQEHHQEARAAAAPPPPLEVDPPDPPTNDLWLTVPKMGRHNDYVANSTDPAVLAQGATKLPPTGFPWQPNANTYIAAHVLGYSGTGSLYQFAELPSMRYGDRIYLTDSAGTTYTYEVTEIMTVTPYDVWVTEPIAGRDMVTLQTCVNPPAYDLRLVVRADRVGVRTTA